MHKTNTRTGGQLGPGWVSRGDLRPDNNYANGRRKEKNGVEGGGRLHSGEVPWGSRGVGWLGGPGLSISVPGGAASAGPAVLPAAFGPNWFFVDDIEFTVTMVTPLVVVPKRFILRATFAYLRFALFSPRSGVWGLLFKGR